LPRKRGFTNIFRIEYSVVNLDKLNTFDPGSKVTPEELLARGMVKSLRYPIKILARGDLDRPLVIKVNKFSAAAKARIEAAGGKVEEMGDAGKAN
jgi:large subunit ribosomal protein L15